MRPGPCYIRGGWLKVGGGPSSALRLDESGGRADLWTRAATARRKDLMIRYIILDRPGAHDHIAGWRGRCTYCGHRVGADVRAETRRRPWRIPAEMVGRFLANAAR